MAHKIASPIKPRTGFLFILVFFLLTAGILTAGYFYYHQSAKHFRKQIEYQLLAVLRLKTAELMQWRDERMGDANSIFNNPSFSSLAGRFLRNPSDAEARDRLQEWLDAVRISYGYNRIFLLDTRGNERIHAPETMEALAPHLQKDAEESLRRHRIIFLDFHRDAPDGPVWLGFLVPIRDDSDSNRLLGVLVFRIDPTVNLYPLIRLWPTESQTAETLIIRKEGDSVVFLNDLRFQPDAALRLRIPIEKSYMPAVKAALGQQGIVEGSDYRGVPVLAAVGPVEGSSWFMVARMDTAEAFAPLRERLWMTIIIVGALLVGAGGSVGLLWRHQFALFYKERASDADALRESEERFRRAILNSPFPVMLHAEDGSVILTSNSWREITGFTREELATVGDWTERAYGERKEQVRAIIDSLYSLDARKSEGEFRIQTKHGATRIWDFSSAPLGYLPDGRRLVLSMAIDVTERREAEVEVRRLNAELEQRVKDRTSQLEEANRELEAFSYSVSHDLRAPLRAIDGFARILVTEYGDILPAGGGRRELDIICSEARRMGQLIDDLLAFSRLARQPLRTIEVDMKELAQSVYADCSRDLIGRNLRFTLDAIPSVQGDPAMLRQVWANLISNAIKFTRLREEAEVHVGGRVDEVTNTYYVKDNGVGFDMKYVHKLFSVFHRLHSEAEFEGTGVGLALAQRVIHRHGGRIWAEGKIKDGAAFYFALPTRKGSV